MGVTASILNATLCGAADRPPLVRAFLGSTSSDNNSTNYSFNNQGFGAVDLHRLIVVTIAGSSDGANISISSVTIGGIGATIAVQQKVEDFGSSCFAGIAYANIPTGTSGNISVDLSGANAQCCGIGRYRMTGLRTFVPTDTDTAPINLNIQRNSFAVGITIRHTGTSDRHSGASRYFANADSSHSVTTSGGANINWSGLDINYQASINAFTNGAIAQCAAVWTGW